MEVSILSNNNEDFEDLGEEFKDLESSTEEILKSKVPIEPVGEGKQVTLYFRSTIGPERTEKVVVGQKTSVEELKETLGHIFNLASHDFHLIHEGRTWDREDIVENFNPDEGDLVLLIPISTAGILKKPF